jgi:hypothetical protein
MESCHYTLRIPSGIDDGLIWLYFGLRYAHKWGNPHEGENRGTQEESDQETQKGQAAATYEAAFAQSWR